METCFGCGAEAEQHPWIGVAKKDVETAAGAARTSEGFPVVSGEWVGVPVCTTCHVNPANRKRNLKVTFFDRNRAPMAVIMAGSANISG